jgi:serine O-acetyltransferase
MRGKEQDVVWTSIRSELERDAKNEPALSNFIHEAVLKYESFESVLGHYLSEKLSTPMLSGERVEAVILEALEDDKRIGEAARADILAVIDRDPACPGYSVPLLYFKGYQSLQCYRVANWLWRNNRRAMALYLQSRISELFGVDIHPAAKIGKGILMDHATGIVIGETATVEDNVSMLHEVTLGGTGKEKGIRHPTIRAGVLIGAGAKILGNVEVGEGAKIGAGSVVISDVPAHTTVAGVPARIVGDVKTETPALQMDHRFNDKDHR